MNFLAKFKDNYLLYMGASIYCCTLVLFLFISAYNFEEVSELSRFGINRDVITHTLLALIVAPLFEELAFRGNLVKNKLLIVFSFLFLSIYVYLFGSNMSISYLFVVIYIIVYFLWKKNNSSRVSTILYFLNALIFALLHYSSSDFNSIYTILPMLLHFASGLIYVWVVVNFSLLYSILLHFTKNFVLTTISILSMQYVDTDVQRVENDLYVLEYQNKKISDYFKNSLKTIKNNNPYELEVENYNAFLLIDLYDIDKNRYRFSDQALPDQPLKLKIYPKSDTISTKLTDSIVVDLMLKADIIEEKKK